MTAQGLRVEYLAAVKAPAQLQLGPLHVSAESLLLTTAADGTQRGIVLGAGAMSVSGHAITLSTPDAEFTLTADGPIAQPIYTPLAPVAISPLNCNVFVGQQTVTLACATPAHRSATPVMAAIPHSLRRFTQVHSRLPWTRRSRPAPSDRA